MSKINWPLIEATMEQIKAAPETWDQSDWVNDCGTAYCFAGHAALICGFPDPYWTDGTGWYMDKETKNLTSFTNPNAVAVSTFAAEHLGLTLTQADDVFNSDNTITDLEVMFNALREDPEREDLDDFRESYEYDYEECSCCG